MRRPVMATTAEDRDPTAIAMSRTRRRIVAVSCPLTGRAPVWPGSSGSVANSTPLLWPACALPREVSHIFRIDRVRVADRPRWCVPSLEWHRGSPRRLHDGCR